jgi:hypothetical protein
MRIHSDHLDELEIRKAARLAGVSFTRFSLHGSRSRAAGFDVILTGSSPRRQNQGEDYAATWDEWGVFLNALFAIDEHAIAGRGGYESAEHFHWSTGGRYRDFDIADQHRAGHRWQWAGDSATGSYHMSECGCGAVRRFLMGRQSFADFVAANR